MASEAKSWFGWYLYNAFYAVRASPSDIPKGGFKQKEKKNNEKAKKQENRVLNWVW